MSRCTAGRGETGIAHRPLIESLEDRRLLAAFVAHINFQPAKSAVPAGYVADTGAVFADRANGFSYGWNTPRPAQVAEHHIRKPSDGPDLRYDTFAVMHARGPGSQWQISLPNGNYQVGIAAGDPRAFGGRQQVLVDGVLFLNGKATKASRWVSGSGQVTVTDSKLSLTVPRGATSKIDFIDITQVVSDANSGTNAGNGSGSSSGNGQGSNGGNGSGGGGTTTGGGGQTSGWTQPFAWKPLANAPQPLAEAQSVAVNGKLYLFGGYNITSPDYQPTSAAEMYDPATNTWHSLAPMPTGETHVGVASDGQNYIYVAGGYTFDPKTTYQTFGTTNVFRYDIANNTWSNYVPLPAPRAAGALVYLDGQLHFFDGVDPTRVGQTEHWVLTPAGSNPQWTTSTALPFSRNHMAGVVLDGKIYAVGGQSTDDDSSTTADVLMWDPAKPSSWTAVASMPGRRSHAVVTAIDGRIVVAGGTLANDVPVDSVIAYDPATNTWSSQTALPEPLLAPAGDAIGNQIIVATGFNNGLRADTWTTTVQ